MRLNNMQSTIVIKNSVFSIRSLRYTLFVLCLCFHANASSQSEDKLSHLVTDLMEQASIPGVSLTVIDNKGTFLNKHFGVSEVKSDKGVNPNTLFEAASLSKPLFAEIVLRLVKQGKINLDTPLIHYLQNSRITHHKYADKITARFVLSHQTGLPNWSEGNLSFLFEPGTQFGYSGEAYVYLQHVVEKLTGKTLQMLASELIFEPLNMTHSTFCWQAQYANNTAKSHNRLGMTIETNKGCNNAASSLYTTAEDYARFVASWIDKVKPELNSITAAIEPEIWLNGDERGGAVLSSQQAKIGWGLGWGVLKSADKTLLWHWGDNDGFKSFVMFDPSQKIALIILSNSNNGLAIVDTISQIVFGDTPAIFEWLQYPQSSQAGWIEKQRALISEASMNYAEAIELFHRSLMLNKQQQELVTRIEWLQELVDAAKDPQPWPPNNAIKVTAKYGPRLIYQKNQLLYYRRGNSKSYRLTPLGQNLYALEGVVEFRIEFKFDQHGIANKIVGHYLSGQTDESLRTEDNPPTHPQI